jgi:DNA repair protein RecN (Recombination protein N)
MLRALAIRNVVLIDKLEIEFGDGLCVLTGETGSGKSILLDALGLALGTRADTDLVGATDGQSSVTAAFELPRKHPALALLAEQGIEADDQLVLRRVVSEAGRSRAFVNDQPVSVSLLRRLGESLVEVHGQFDTHGLLDPATHVRFVDAYGGAEGLADEVSAAWAAWGEAKKALAAAEEEQKRARRDEDYLRHAADELAKIDPRPGEESELADRRVLLMHGEQILAAMHEAQADLARGGGVEGALQAALQKLQRVSEKAPGRLDATIAAFERALIEVNDGTAELERAAGGLDLDPRALEAAEERLFELRRLARKHDIDVTGLVALRDEIERKLASLEDGGAQLAQLAKAVTAQRAAFVSAAERLTQAREKAADKLKKAVEKELPSLMLPAARFRARLEALEEAAWGPGGRERVVFEVQTNPNTAAGALNRIASGGELARIMLALKVALAAADKVPTLIFDEVDSGVGGAAAAAVGERLAKLAERVQVLVVTHSPQVAARGSRHLRIAKVGSAKAHRTQVDLLDASAREEEIARMLAGAQVTEEARAAAGRLMAAK